jgi:hypothetical protein
MLVYFRLIVRNIQLCQFHNCSLIHRFVFAQVFAFSPIGDSKAEEKTDCSRPIPAAAVTAETFAPSPGLVISSEDFLPESTSTYFEKGL